MYLVQYPIPEVLQSQCMTTGVRTRGAGGGGGGNCPPPPSHKIEGGRAPLIFRLLYKPGGGAHPLRFALFFFICCHNQG